jgi:type II secretory pathway pseudopilin PulG
MPTPRARSLQTAQRGFSLLELVISLFIAVEILVAAALAFDVHNRVAAIQVQVTDLQQSMRVAQYDLVRSLRSAARGNLPPSIDPDAIFNVADPIPARKGLAVEVRNNVAGTDRFVSLVDNTSPQAIQGTDILTVRGCLSGTAYQVDPSTFYWDVDPATGLPPGDGVADDDAQLTIPKTSVAGLLQSLVPLTEELEAYEDEDGNYPAVIGRFILVSPTALQDYAVADITGFQVNGDADDPDSVVLTLDLNNASTLNPPDSVTGVRQYPTNMTASMGCFLEEYRYYVREVVGDTITPLRPRLTRARFEPGTELPYLGDTSSFSLDLADGIFDLQVALGLDSDFREGYGGAGVAPGSYNDDSNWTDEDDMIFEAPRTDDDATRGEDDWLYNASTDDPTDPEYSTHAYGTNAGQPVQLYYVRVTTIGRTNRPDPNYQAPDFDTTVGSDWIEDRDYDAAPASTYKTGDNNKHRRRVLQTVVDLRNV